MERKTGTLNTTIAFFAAGLLSNPLAGAAASRADLCLGLTLREKKVLSEGPVRIDHFVSGVALFEERSGRGYQTGSAFLSRGRAEAKVIKGLDLNAPEVGNAFSWNGSPRVIREIREDRGVVRIEAEMPNPKETPRRGNKGGITLVFREKRGNSPAFFELIEPGKAGDLVYSTYLGEILPEITRYEARKGAYVRYSGLSGHLGFSTAEILQGRYLRGLRLRTLPERGATFEWGDGIVYQVKSARRVPGGASIVFASPADPRETSALTLKIFVGGARGESDRMYLKISEIHPPNRNSRGYALVFQAEIEK